MMIVLHNYNNNNIIAIAPDTITTINSDSVGITLVETTTGRVFQVKESVKEVLDTISNSELKVTIVPPSIPGEDIAGVLS